MQTAEADLSRIKHLLNTWHQRQACAVPQFDQIKTKFAFDFTQHFVPGSVTSGVPASRKRDHAKQQRRPVAPASRRRASLRLQVANILSARERAPLAQLRRSSPLQSPAPCAYRSDQIVR